MLESDRAGTQIKSRSIFYDFYYNGLGFIKVDDRVWEGGVDARKVHVDEEAKPGLWRVVVLHTAHVRLFEGLGAKERAFACAVRIATDKFSGKGLKLKIN